MSASPAAASSVGNQSSPETISLDTSPGLMRPGQRIIAGTRNAPSQLVFFSLRNGVVAGIRPGALVRAVVGRVDDDGVVGDAELVDRLQQLADIAVVLDHAVGILVAGHAALAAHATAGRG